MGTHKGHTVVSLADAVSVSVYIRRCTRHTYVCACEENLCVSHCRLNATVSSWVPSSEMPERH